jgi:hypothetical protein
MKTVKTKIMRLLLLREYRRLYKAFYLKRKRKWVFKLLLMFLLRNFLCTLDILMMGLLERILRKLLRKTRIVRSAFKVQRDLLLPRRRKQIW